MASTLASRDQENLVRNHGFAPKTPVPNTKSTKVPLNTGRSTIGRRGNVNEDENIPLRTGKKNQPFVTPVAPRTQNRAPLGQKTTNAKAKGFQTPALGNGKQKLGQQQNQQSNQRRTSARKTKLKVHQQLEPAGAEEPFAALNPEQANLQDISARSQEGDGQDSDTDSVPSIEYCPPKPVDLPDGLDFPEIEFGEDKTFPQFAPENYFRGMDEIYRERVDPTGEDGLRKSQREAEQREKEWWKSMEDKMLKDMEERETESDARLFGIKKEQVKGKTNQRPGSVKARDAVKALNSRAPAQAKAASKGPSTLTAPTAASRAKKTSNLPSAAAKPIPRNIPGTAASKNTIGYAQGRKVSSSLKAAGQTNDCQKALTHEVPAEQDSRQSTIMHDLLAGQGSAERAEPEMLEESRNIEKIFRDPFLDDFQLEVPVLEEQNGRSG